jgi:hypothetical protein
MGLSVPGDTYQRTHVKAKPLSHSLAKSRNSALWGWLKGPAKEIRLMNRVVVQSARKLARPYLLSHALAGVHHSLLGFMSAVSCTCGYVMALLMLMKMGIMIA